MSPFRALYGRQPPAIVTYMEGSTQLQEVHHPLLQRRHLLKQIRSTLFRTRQSMRDSANIHRREASFQPNEFVWLRLRAFRQHSVVRRGSQKLA